MVLPAIFTCKAKASVNFCKKVTQIQLFYDFIMFIGDLEEIHLDSTSIHLFGFSFPKPPSLE